MGDFGFSGLPGGSGETGLSGGTGLTGSYSINHINIPPTMESNKRPTIHYYADGTASVLRKAAVLYKENTEIFCA